MLKMPIFHASVQTHDAESDICMDIILKYNTCIRKPHSIINQLFISFFRTSMCKFNPKNCASIVVLFIHIYYLIGAEWRIHASVIFIQENTFENVVW